MNQALSIGTDVAGQIDGETTVDVQTAGGRSLPVMQYAYDHTNDRLVVYLLPQPGQPELDLLESDEADWFGRVMERVVEDRALIRVVVIVVVAVLAFMAVWPFVA